MGTKRNVDMSATTDTIKVVAAPVLETTDTEPTATNNEAVAEAPASSAEDSETAPVAPTKTPRRAHQRSSRYQKVRAQVDKTRLYDVFSAVELVKKLSYTKFEGTITAHGIVREADDKAEVAFPHSTGRALRVAIADEALLTQIEAGQIEFDVLISAPSMMPKLAKFARVLGPRGLMPNPKNGTITEDPAKAKKSFESGKTIVKTEKKAPLIHVNIGKTSMETKDLVENIQALTKAFKGKLLKLTLAASMSPGVKVEIN